MGWLDELRGGTVAIDTAPLIYFMQEHPRYLPIVRPFFEALDRGDFEAVTSTITLLEVLVHPLRTGDLLLSERYRDILCHARHLTLVDVTRPVSEEAARLRANTQLRTPDALQLATALNQHADVFVTNDARLPSVDGICTLVLDHMAL